MSVKKYDEKIWNKDLKEITINKEATNIYFKKCRTGSVRLALGMICTKEEFEATKKEVLNYKFP